MPVHGQGDIGITLHGSKATGEELVLKRGEDRFTPSATNAFTFTLPFVHSRDFPGGMLTSGLWGDSSPVRSRE